MSPSLRFRPEPADDLGLSGDGGADGAGVVASTGPGAVRYPVGTRVFFDPGLSDGTCDYCARGEHSLCDTWEILGEHRDGTFAQAVRLAVKLTGAPRNRLYERALKLSKDDRVRSSPR